MAAVTLRDIQAALHKKSSFEVIEHSEADNQLRVMGRQPRDQMNTNLANWLLVVRQVLQQSAKLPWSVDVSKQYFLRGDNVIYGWRLIFQGEGIKEHYESILQTVLGAPFTSRGELTEFPLPGAPPDRNVPEGGKRGVYAASASRTFVPGRG